MYCDMLQIKMEGKLSYFCIQPHLKNLRYSGAYQLNHNSTNTKKVLHTLYRLFVLFLSISFVIQQLLHVYQVRSDPYKVIDTMSLFLTHSDTIYKQLVLWVKADRIEQLLHIMSGPMFNHNNSEHRAQLRRTERQGRLFLRVFNLVALSTCLMWALYPVILRFQGKHVQFSIWLPFDTNTSSKFIIGAAYVWVQTSWIAFNNTTMDAYVSVLLAQSKTQLSILRVDLKNLVKDIGIPRDSSLAAYNDIVGQRFRKLLAHFDAIIHFTNQIQNVFGSVVLYQFLISSWIICTTAHRIVNIADVTRSYIKNNRVSRNKVIQEIKSTRMKLRGMINPASVEFVSVALYMCCILTELLLFCYFGNEVTHESERLLQSAYYMNWPDLPLSQQRNLIIFMERIKRPIRPMAGAIIPLSNTTFLSILRSSYSFYAFLKNTSQ